MSDLSLFGWGTALGAVLGYLLRVLVEHRLAKSRATEDRTATRFNAAADALRTAFADEIAFLNSVTPAEEGATYDKLKDAFPRHERAIFVFAEYLPDSDRTGFLNAWKDYYYPVGANLVMPEVEVPQYMLAQYIGTNAEEEQLSRQRALHHITRLLAFARSR
jgi:hypothetical protein